MTVEPLFADHQRGSFLCTVELWRRPDGTIQSVLQVMDGKLIETTGEDVPDRVGIIAEWLLEGAADMAEQAKTWAAAYSEDPTP